MTKVKVVGDILLQEGSEVDLRASVDGKVISAGLFPTLSGKYGDEVLGEIGSHPSIQLGYHFQIDIPPRSPSYIRYSANGDIVGYVLQRISNIRYTLTQNRQGVRSFDIQCQVLYRTNGVVYFPICSTLGKTSNDTFIDSVMLSRFFRFGQGNYSGLFELLRRQESQPLESA